MEFINLTPHDVVLSVGGMKITFEKNPTTPVARVELVTEEKEIKYDVAPNITLTMPVTEITRHEVTGLPLPKPGVMYIVSSMVASHVKRADLIAPLTDSSAERNSMGRVTSVTMFQTFKDMPEEEPKMGVKKSIPAPKRFGTIGSKV